MSVGGPCLWLPSLSSPVPSPLAQDYLTTTIYAKKEEPGVPVPVHVPARPVEMQPVGFKAENALNNPVAQPVSMGSAPYLGRDVSRDTVNQRLEAAKQDMLPRVKLEIPSLNQRVFSSVQPLVGPGHHEEAGISSFSGHDSRDDHERESTISPDDDKDIMGSDDNRSPSMEKKKMKRFRLTHNQTRFLMSEFTRQAHPDAAHRERLSREIPGLTPRQVQVWFQNRRAKLKRLTTNDRERMLKSRALPDDFDTTKVLRTPFEGKQSGATPVASPQGYAAPNPDFGTLRTLRTDCYPRPNEDEYLVSPLSSASTAGTYMSSTGRNDSLPQSNMMFRPAASASMSDLHRTIRNDYPITRSSSLSDASAHPSAYAGYHMHNRFAGPQPNQPGLPYMRRPMEYAIPRHPGNLGPYDQHQSFEGSVSPTDTQNPHIAYDMHNLGPQQQNYNLGMGSQLPTQGRPMATMQNLPVSAAQDYRPYSYEATTGPMGTPIPYTQANTSTLSLPTSEPPYNYPNYIQQ
ncbi:Homeodomain [Penicillium vulpinum]|uniref:Homeodomain n=1 Tax=Penicillium vulpinum TaxID=29845 RepID=UPI0025482E03|nr:Homeodomain [Penicillium vulpinum]KAJ5964522.1 Homeodomain [Penicillium vulpinum]